MQAPPNPPNNDGIAADNGGATQPSQQTQQPTQVASEQTDAQTAMDSHLWGFLIPCSPEMRRIDFSRVQPTYQVGRNANHTFQNDLILPGMKISEFLVSVAPRVAVSLTPSSVDSVGAECCVRAANHPPQVTSTVRSRGTGKTRRMLRSEYWICRATAPSYVPEIFPFRIDVSLTLCFRSTARRLVRVDSVFYEKGTR